MIDAVESARDRRGVPIESVSDVCRFVDGLEEVAAGELLVTGAGADGAVFVEDARICWAAAAGLARRLTELLMLHAGVDHGTMESLYSTCKEQGLPLGEYLVRRQIVGADALRAALAQHTVESLLAIVGPGGWARWLPRPHGGYSARFTFGTAEVLSLAGGVGEPTLAERARLEMAHCFQQGEWAVAFQRAAHSSTARPVALHGPAPQSAATIVRYAKWACSALDVSGAFGGMPELVAVSLPESKDGDTLVAYIHDDIVIVGGGGAHCAARLLNRRAQRRREGG